MFTALKKENAEPCDCCFYSLCIVDLVRCYGVMFVIVVLNLPAIFMMKHAWNSRFV